MSRPQVHLMGFPSCYIIPLLLLLLYCSIWNKVRHRPWFKKAVRITANISLWRQGIGISVLHPLPFGIASNEDSQDCLHSPCCLACNSWGQTKGWWHFSHILRWRYFWIKESVRRARRRGQTRVAAQQKSKRFHGPLWHSQCLKWIHIYISRILNFPNTLQYARAQDRKNEVEEERANGE